MYPAAPGPLYTPRTRKYILDNFSPAGLHVLVVDDDPLCLMVLERMLRQCNYKATTCNRVSHALELLREEDKDFDLVISDVYMPDEDGFKLLEVIGLELDLPVIMISANGDFSVVMKGIIHGACDYLIKPVRIEELRNIWQHVIRRKGKDFCRLDLQGENDVDAPAPESQEELYRKRILEIPDFGVDDISSSPKKARVNWSVQLHHQFVNAVNQLGVDKAVPKKILEIMNVQGLSRENVASHLQKYRLYLKRLSGVIPEPCPVASFQASDDGMPGGSMLIKPGRNISEPVSSVKGLNLGAGLGSKMGKAQKVDTGTMKTLSQLKSLQQRQAANRAQVLSAIGVGEASCAASLSRGGLFRMASLDVSFFLQAAHEPKKEALSPRAPCVKVMDDLAACSVSRSVKLEDDVVLPGHGTGESMYDLRKQSNREGSFAHSSDIARVDKQGSMIGSAVNIRVDELKLDRCGSLSVEVDKLNSGYTDPAYMHVLSEETKKCQGDPMLSNINQVRNVDYDFAFGLFGTPNMLALQADVTPASSSVRSKLDYGQDELQPIQEVTKGVAISVDEATDDTDNSTKQSFELSAGSAATEMSGETFSNCSFETLIGDLGIIPHTQQHLVQQTNSELLDVDEYLQLD